ncbi:hypothetical protein [Anatilimnocola aggregata]|uniref:hypothetical protein n=1 Tax=Anatilimnocola aggregata TaxID=2528021 RepID=UPI0011A079B7|nr:hypothetical protein [Anatilimnocola aggregata]
MATATVGDRSSLDFCAVRGCCAVATPPVTGMGFFPMNDCRNDPSLLLASGFALELADAEALD